MLIFSFFVSFAPFVVSPPNGGKENRLPPEVARATKAAPLFRIYGFS